MERKILLLWFKRFNTVNNGILRITAILAYLIFLLSIIVLYPNLSDSSDPIILNLFKTILASIPFYLLTIVILRIGLWVVDGFKN